jgi:hypothetical protein
VTGGWRKLHNLYSSLSISTIKSRGVRLAVQVARMGKTRNIYNISVGKPEGKRPFGHTSEDGRMIFKWTSRRGVDCVV